MSLFLGFVLFTKRKPYSFDSPKGNMARKILFPCISLYGNTANAFLDPGITIDSIVALEPGYPVTVLTEDQGRTCNFAVNDLEAWHKAVDDRSISSHPLALPSNDLIFFWITVTAAPAYLNRKYTLTALRDETTFLHAPVPVELLYASQSIRGVRMAISSPTTPWCYAGNVKWIMQDTETEQQVVLGSTKIEIYILSPDVPEYMSNVGISQRLLKEVVPPYVNSQNPSLPTPWHEFVIHYLFNHEKLWYETWHGIGTYASYKRDPTVKSACWIDLWLSDLTTPLSKTKLRSIVNCYDMATSAQVILSLGIGRSAAPAMKYMEPYRYITPTRLIGRHGPDRASNGTDLCNNPCYGSGVNPPEMLCTINEHTRSYFGNHMFLTLVLNGEEREFDACVGP